MQVAQVGDPADHPLNADLQRGIQRIEDVASGKVTGLTEEQFQAALK